MSLLEKIKARNKRREALRKINTSEEEINEILTQERLILVKKEEESSKEEENEIETPSNEEYIYCVGCKHESRVINATIRRIEIKKGSFRRFLSGFCFECGNKVSKIMKFKLKDLKPR